MATQYVRRTRLAMIETCLGNKDDARIGRLLSMVGLQ
jgi:hypothetical protein